MLDYPPVGRRKYLPGFWGKGGSCLDSWAGSVVLLYLSDPPNFHMLFTAESSLTILVHSLALPWTFSLHVLECSISQGILKVSRVRLKTSWVLLKLSRVRLKSSWVRLKVSQGILKLSQVRLKSSQVLLNQFSWVISVAINSSSAESSSCWVITFYSAESFPVASQVPLLNSNSVTVWGI